MDHFKQLETFVAVATRGSLSAAAAAEGVAPAIIGRRIDALEERLGVKLLVRTTRRITLTFEGSAFLEDCQRILNDLHNAEASVSAGGVKASGHLRVTAPAGFGRRHVAPMVPDFIETHPDVSMTLDLGDRVVDLVNEGFDCAIRLGDLPDSSLVSIRLWENRRVVVAAPSYLAAHGTPRRVEDLAVHNCLTYSYFGKSLWKFTDAKTGAPSDVPVGGNLSANESMALLAAAREGAGIALQPVFAAAPFIASGQLVRLLPELVPQVLGIHGVYSSRRQMPAALRAMLDFLADWFKRVSSVI